MPDPVDTTIRDALTAVRQDLLDLRAKRKDDDRKGLAEVEEMRLALIARRRETNDLIKAKLAEHKRLAALVRVLDKH